MLKELSGDDIAKLKLGLASPEEILSWSKGAVTESETINYRTHRPEKGGLFAEEIFGPEEDYECACKKYRGRKHEGIKCEKCGVFVLDSSVRRSNMGHIELASPVVHFWYFKGISSPLSTLLGTKRNVLKKIAYYETEPIQQEVYIITSPRADLETERLLYQMQYDILAGKKKFTAEPAYVIESAPQVVTGVEGKVAIERMKLENGEELTLIKIGEKNYPLSPRAPLLVKEGDKVKAGEVLATSPVGDEYISETKYNFLRSVYPDLGGKRAVEQVDNLIFLVTSVKSPAIPLRVGMRLWELEKQAYEMLFPGQFEAHTGALGIKEVLRNLDLEGLAKELQDKLAAEESEGIKKRILKRLEVVNQLRKSGNRPQDMVLEILPVLPPDLRPIVQLEGGKFATTDLNDLYRRIINRNNRLKKLMEMGAPEVILRNERRMLQEAVDALIHNEKKDNPILGRDNRPLKSLSERIQGKHGRLRRNLLGKRVDYSGRAVIVVNPKLKLHQCGLPKRMALELFKPFILHRLQQLDTKEITPFTNYDEIKNKALRGEMPAVWDILEELIKEHPVLLNRAPTLHRLGIQAFEPVLVDGEAIQIHPFVCPPYNADFDGDAMTVHLPLSKEAIWEAREIMLSSKNILSPANGEPLSMPTYDLIFAFFYLTIENPKGKGQGKCFSTVWEAERAYDGGLIDLQTPVKIRLDGKLLDTTLGRVKLNLLFPEELRDFTKVYDADEIKRVIMECYHRYGNERTVELLDALKELGAAVATKSGLTICVRDCLIPSEKDQILKEAYARVNKITEMYQRGLATDDERKEAVINIWMETVNKVEEATMKNLAQHVLNPVYLIVNSGAKGGSSQVKQLSGMRGPMTDPSGRIIEMPVVSNFREGLNIMEYFISTHGGRKGTADTALKTADSGYLTRRLVDATEELIVKEEDCGTTAGIDIDPLRYSKDEIMETIAERIYGRVAAETIKYDGKTLLERGELIGQEKAKELGELVIEINTDDRDFIEKAVGMKSVSDVKDPRRGTVIVNQDELISSYSAKRIKESGVKRIRVRPNIIIRSSMTCETRRGVCRLCYGLDLSNHQLVKLGTAVGVIAAQSIGEPGTQLTMRTFHMGGVVGEDITQGLPRAEELFEARKAIKSAQGEIAPISGNIVAIEPTPEGRERVTIHGEPKSIKIPRAILSAEEGAKVSTQAMIHTKSPRSGEIRIIENGRLRKLYILNSEEGDRVYHLPPGVKPAVETGQQVKAGAVLSEPFYEEPVVAKRDGTVDEIVEDGERYIVIKDGKGARIRYRIPYGARKQVEVGERVTKGTKLTSRSAPVEIQAQNAGVAIVSERLVLIYSPNDLHKEFTLTDDLILLKEDGTLVKEGEELFALNIPQGDVVIDKVSELRDGLAEVSFHYEGTLELSSTAVVKVGDKVQEGDLLSKGVVSPHRLLQIAGFKRTRDYLFTEIHKVYKSQGVDINDKHLELVIRQMLNNVRIKDPGDSEFFPNQIVILEEFREVVEQLSKGNREIRRQREEILGLTLVKGIRAKGTVIAEKGEEFTRELLRAAMDAGVEEVTVEGREGEKKVAIRERRLPVGERVLLRISKAALETKSWLSAASFMRTTTVLAEAALKGAIDHLEGLKPNVTISRKIPAGTGFVRPEATPTEE